VSLLIGPIGAGSGTWRRWASATGRSVVFAHRNAFPFTEWIRTVVEQIDLPALAIEILAQQANRDPKEFLKAWEIKTPADREQLWSTLVPDVDDDLLRSIANLPVSRDSRRVVAASLSDLSERVVPMIVRLVPSGLWPSVLFFSSSIDELSLVGYEAAKWAERVPALPIAVATTGAVWDAFLTTATESRAKALLREGELEVPGVDAATVEQTLIEAGAEGRAIAAVAANVVDAALIESAVQVVQATAAPPPTSLDDDCARSVAERFLFEFLQSLPETAGRFELNATLDFQFGPRPVEIDLLCREPRIALEIDGYFHFLDSACYRRDRTKDWELQRRGYLVLRFLAEDIIPQLESVRDRIIDALASHSVGELI
jgi:hypothetical protein